MTRNSPHLLVGSHRRQRVAWAGLMAWLGLLVAFAYGNSLSLPYMADDYFHIPFVNTHSLTQIWQTAEGLYYFRPVSFTLWKLMQFILGRNDLVAQHGLNLLLHWGNSLLVGWLAGHVSHQKMGTVPWAAPLRDQNPIDWRRRYLSASLFLLYPFSYEAVPWIGSLVHPLVTALILLSVASYLKMRAMNPTVRRPFDSAQGRLEAAKRRGLSRNRAWGVLSFACALLAVFTHENGVLIVPLLAAIELTQPSPSEPLGHRMRRVALWIVPTLLWLPIWRLVPADRGAGSLALNTATDALRNGLYFAQGTAYPLTWLGGRLRDGLGLDQFAVAAALSTLALSGAALVQAYSRSGRRAWLAWLWIGISASPVAFFLDFWYVSAAPRMLMLASAGVAWLWADVFLRLADWGRVTLTRRRISQALAAGLCVVVLVQNYTFIREQMQIYELGGSAIRQAVDATAATNETGQTALFINLPVWIASPRPTYAIGQEGVVFVFTPPSDQIGAITSIHTDRPARMNALRWDAIRQEMPYYVGVMGTAPDWGNLAQVSGQVFIADYRPDEISIRPVGELAVSVPAAEPMARFGSAIDLLATTAVISRTHLQVDLTWQVHAPPSPDVTLFVHVFDASGQLLAQADGDPLAGSYPFWQWPPGSIARDRRSIEVSDSGLSLPPKDGDYSVRIGLYNRASGERLPATSASGAVWADNAVPIPIQLPLGDLRPPGNPTP